MSNWRSYSTLTLVLAGAAFTVWLALPPNAVSSPVVESPPAQSMPVPGMAERFDAEKGAAREEPLPAQF